MKIRFKTVALFLAYALVHLGALANSYLEAARDRATIYYSLGEDSAAIEAVITPSVPMEFISHATEKQELKPKLISDIKDLVHMAKHCVFYSEGNYGPHLSDELRDRISVKFGEFLIEALKNAKEAVYYYRIDKPLAISDIASQSSCTLAIEHKGSTLLMNGYLDIP